MLIVEYALDTRNSFMVLTGGEGRPPNIWWQGREHRGELGSAGDPGHRDEGAAAVHKRVQDRPQLDQLAIPVKGNGYRHEYRRQGEHRTILGTISCVSFSLRIYSSFGFLM